MAYLEQYVHEHFAAEQQMMELSGYAHLGDHIIAHHGSRTSTDGLSNAWTGRA